jgi:tRNA(fMet)-specific endonuclease VapC
MRCMRDTDICIHASDERPPKVLQALRERHAAGLGVSATTASQLFRGVARPGSARNAQVLRRFLAALEVAEFDASAAEVAAQRRSWLAGQGAPIGPCDGLIAADAQALGVTLVTNSLREFEPVHGLRLATCGPGDGLEPRRPATSGEGRCDPGGRTGTAGRAARRAAPVATSRGGAIASRCCADALRFEALDRTSC